MKIKTETNTSNENILELFDEISNIDEYTPLTVTNKGRDITLHIKPSDYSDHIHHQYAQQQVIIAAMGVKETIQAAQDGYETDVAVSALKAVSFEIETAAHAKFAYSLLAKNIREVSELTHEQLESRNVISREQFVEKLLDANATGIIYDAIMGLGRKKADKHADKTLDIADVVKN